VDLVLVVAAVSNVSSVSLDIVDIVPGKRIETLVIPEKDERPYVIRPKCKRTTTVKAANGIDIMPKLEHGGIWHNA